MSSAGSIMDMISKIRNNRNLQKKSRYFDELKNDRHVRTKISYLDTEATPEQLETIRVELAKQKKKSRTTSTLVLIAILIITGLAVKFLLLDLLIYYFS